MGFLTDLVGTIRRELDERPLPLEALDAAARSRPPARSLRDALRRATVPAVIAGADSVLLIAACLDDGLLDRMLTAARALGMEPLLETHSDRDLERALATDAEIIGINARDLHTLEVDVPAALGRLRSIPRGRIAVLES